jgi:NAD(P)-dependent dehydrogenase (short-subunit alcohol dehydrogenase family)
VRYNGTADHTLIDTGTKTAVEELGCEATIYEADLAAAESVTGSVPTILKDLNGHRIGILLNCAGVQQRQPS